MDLVDEKAIIFGLLFVLANRIQILGDKVDPELSIKQWLFIAVTAKFGDEAPTLTQIAGEMGSSHQNAKKMAVILENGGFIRLRRDERDARAVRIERTEKCEAHFKEMEQKELGFIEALFAGLSKTEIRGLYLGMKGLADNVAEMENRHENAEKR